MWLLIQDSDNNAPSTAGNPAAVGGRWQEGSWRRKGGNSIAYRPNSFLGKLGLICHLSKLEVKIMYEIILQGVPQLVPQL